MRTIVSSRIVLTATQSGSDSDEIVGLLQRRQDGEHAGRGCRGGTFIIRPTLPSAAIAPCSISTRSSIFSLLPRVGVGLRGWR